MSNSHDGALYSDQVLFFKHIFLGVFCASSVYHLRQWLDLGDLAIPKYQTVGRSISLAGPTIAAVIGLFGARIFLSWGQSAFIGAGFYTVTALLMTGLAHWFWNPHTQRFFLQKSLFLIIIGIASGIVSGLVADITRPELFVPLCLISAAILVTNPWPRHDEAVLGAVGGFALLGASVLLATEQLYNLSWFADADVARPTLDLFSGLGLSVACPLSVVVGMYAVGVVFANLKYEGGIITLLTIAGALAGLITWLVAGLDVLSGVLVAFAAAATLVWLRTIKEDPAWLTFGSILVMFFVIVSDSQRYLGTGFLGQLTAAIAITYVVTAAFAAFRNRDSQALEINWRIEGSRSHLLASTLVAFVFLPLLYSVGKLTVHVLRNREILSDQLVAGVWLDLAVALFLGMCISLIKFIDRASWSTTQVILPVSVCFIGCATIAVTATDVTTAVVACLALCSVVLFVSGTVSNAILRRQSAISPCAVASAVPAFVYLVYLARSHVIASVLCFVALAVTLATLQRSRPDLVDELLYSQTVPRDRMLF